MKYKISTVKEIVEVVNEKNLEAFMVDFRMWLTIAIDMKKQNNPFLTMLTDKFTWLDDGKHEFVSNVKIVFPKKGKK